MSRVMATRRVTMAVLAVVMLAASASAQTSKPATVQVNLTAKGVPFSKDLLGVNIDTEDALEGNYKTSRYYESLAPLNTPVVRFPGGLVANSYRWMQTLGPIEKRQKQWDWNHTRQFEPQFGAGEFLVLLMQLRAKGMISLNVCEGTVEEAAAWVAFCRGRIGDRRAIGVDKNGVDWKTVDFWAKKRFSETGLYGPIDVPYWELGNETVGGPKFNGLEYDDAKTYCIAVLPMAKKIREIDPNVFIGWLAMDDGVLKDHKDLVDYLIVHYYTGWPRSGDRVMMWGAGPVTAEFDVPIAGDYAISFAVMGHGLTPRTIAANKYPLATIAINGKTVDERELKTMDWQTLTYTQSLSAGRHTLTVTYSNDYCEKGEDINMAVSKRFSVTQGQTKTEFPFPEKTSDVRADAASVGQFLKDAEKSLAKTYPNAFIAMTEFNRMECSNFDMGAALYNAEIIRLCSEVPAVKTAQIWEACSWNFGLMASCNGIHRPVYYVYEMMKRLHGRKVPARFVGEERDLRVLATTDPITGRFSILLLNFGTQAKSVRLSDAKAKMRNMQAVFIHAGSLDVDNESGVKITPETKTLDAAAAIELPGASAMMIAGQYEPALATQP